MTARKTSLDPVPLAVTNRWRDFISVPGLNSFGRWESFTWDNKGSVQYGARLVPSAAPWRLLFDALDEIGATLADAPVSLEDEIDALVACCWRYGSYTHMLTGGELFPAFRSNSELSRVDDSEMKRINIEFSASLADWLRLRRNDQPRLTRRVRAALECLPVPWRSRRQPWWEDWVRHAAKRRAEDLVAAISQLSGLDLPWSTEPGDRLRRAANWMVLASYRNGPVEDLHAGTWSHGSEIPGFLRLYAEDLTKLASNISERLAIHLLTYDHMAPEAQDLCASAGAPRDWSPTDETSSVAFYGMPDAGDLLPRLRYLALRYPNVFGAEFRAG